VSDAAVEPPGLPPPAHRSRGGECAWTRADAKVAAAVLAQRRLAVLGGEVWRVVDGRINGVVPQRSGPPAVYAWDSRRNAGESWQAYVERCARESQTWIERWPEPDDLPTGLDGTILYNLTWVDEREYRTLVGPSR
jgi:hypothetical protein